VADEMKHSVKKNYNKILETDVSDIGVNMFGENNDLLAFGQIFGKITMCGGMLVCFMYLLFNTYMMLDRQNDVFRSGKLNT